MDIRKCLSLLALAMLGLLSFYAHTTDACSCMPSHPQTHYCTSDYAILVRVLRKSRRVEANKVAYKVEIKKSYKINQMAQKMLRHGRLITPESDMMCGITLEIGRLYVISGRAPHLNLCNYVKEYTSMSVVERRGFSGAYRKACNCTVDPCFGNGCTGERESITGCKWPPLAKCETTHSACMPVTYRTPEGLISKCHWRRTPSYKECMADP